MGRSRIIVALVLLGVASSARAASFELVPRVTQSPTVAEWRTPYTVRVLVEIVSAADEEDLDAPLVVARDVELEFRPTRIVRRAEVLGYPTPTPGQPLDLFIGNASTVLLHLETAPTSSGSFLLGKLRVRHAPFGPESTVEMRRDLWITFVWDPETRADQEAKAAEEAKAEEPKPADAVEVVSESADDVPVPESVLVEIDEGEPEAGLDPPEPIEPVFDARVEARAAAIEAVFAETGAHMGNPAAETTLAECLRENSFHLVLDPGHDVDDPRANRVWEEFAEFELNDDFVERLHKRLSLPRLRISWSRERDEASPLRERVRAIAAKRPDLVVSIHHDNVRWSRQNAKRVRGEVVRSCDDHIGFSVYVGTARGHGDEAQRAGRFIADGLLSVGRLPGRFYSWGDVEHGVYTGNGLYLLRNLEPPSVLVEVGYMCNPVELRLAQSRRIVDQHARVVADAIRRYVASSHCARPVPEAP